MSGAVKPAPAPGVGAFGLEPGALQALRAFFDATEGVQRVWVFGSRARGDWRARSDIDLAVDAPGWSAQEFLRLKERMKDLPSATASCSGSPGAARCRCRARWARPT